MGIIGALVKVDNSEVISFLITTEIIPLCLRIMEDGNELCKTVSLNDILRVRVCLNVRVLIGGDIYRTENFIG